ncbi:MAG: LCP family protein [Clostridia bacterium]|jgi:LCP family protein required for cell wall assembly
MGKRKNANNNAAQSGKNGSAKKKMKKKGINKNKLALTVSFIVLVFIIGGLFIHGELMKFNEDGIIPIDYVKANDTKEPVSGTEAKETDPKSSTQENEGDNITGNVDNKPKETANSETKIEEVPKDPYYEMVNNSNRINVLCFGIADYLLADTIMLVSLDPDNLTADVISVPRDTFYHTKGRDEPYMKKINAYYYGNNSVERTQNMINTVSALLKLPIHYYVKIEFDGVIAIVDCIGGVTVDIPFDMDYDDPEANLHIHFKEGKNQLLNGQQSLEFLRFRMNNDGTRSDGDIGRIYRQQQFLKTAIKKALGLNLLSVVNVAQNYVKTNMKPAEIVSMATKFMSIRMEDVSFHLLPGYPDQFGGGDYWVCSEEKAKEMITRIYKGLDKEVNSN